MKRAALINWLLGMLQSCFLSQKKEGDWIVGVLWSSVDFCIGEFIAKCLLRR